MLKASRNEDHIQTHFVYDMNDPYSKSIMVVIVWYEIKGKLSFPSFDISLLFVGNPQIKNKETTLEFKSQISQSV